jgi:NAD(P)-dependent dehydrogenase (short-subunit alcohol dehydrogenase family)
MTETLPTKAALVTGGAQGIGKACTAKLLAEGWGVLAFDADAEACAALADAHRGRPLATHAGDVADEEAVEAAVGAAIDAFGRLDGVVNNAGVMVSAPVEALELDAWRRCLDVNLTGAVLLAKHAAAHLRAAKGALVQIASTRAHMSEPDTEAYAATKGGLVALTHALAISLGPEVRSNCVSPGWIDVSRWGKPGDRAPEELSDEDHAQHPVGRVGRPEDVAEAVAWLLSEASGFVTGAELVVDGGMTRKMIYL